MEMKIAQNIAQAGLTKEDPIKSQFYKPSVQNAVTKQIHFQISATTTGESKTGRNKPIERILALIFVQHQSCDQREKNQKGQLKGNEDCCVEEAFPEAILSAA